MMFDIPSTRFKRLYRSGTKLSFTHALLLSSVSLGHVLWKFLHFHIMAFAKLPRRYASLDKGIDSSRVFYQDGVYLLLSYPFCPHLRDNKLQNMGVAITSISPEHSFKAIIL